MHKLLKNLINHVGKKGTVLIPTYNYDFPKNKNLTGRNLFSSRCLEILGIILQKIEL